VPCFRPISIMLPGSGQQIVPCGQCRYCRMEYSRQWAIRCMHEAQMYKPNECSFLTLTKKDVGNGSLDKRDLQLFFKNLRYQNGNGIRYFACGEYGKTKNRPHYHVCLYGLPIKDKIYMGKSKSSQKIYTSKTIGDVWDLGYNYVGELTFESAAYVARYCTKKITGEKGEEHYDGRLPEFALMSRRPGIGRSYYDKYKNDMYPYDELIIRGGKKCTPPRYYDKMYTVSDPEDMERIKKLRSEKKKDEYMSYNTLRRLEYTQFLNDKKIKRTMEESDDNEYVCDKG